MFKTLVNAFRDKDIRRRIFITLGLLILFRIGCFIPIPGLDMTKISTMTNQNDFMSLMSIMTGGAMQNGTLFALGILPFINSFIIMQLLTLIIPKLSEWSKGGDDDRRKLTQVTRYVAIILAVIQAIGICMGWRGAYDTKFMPEPVIIMCVIVILTAGSTFVMWLGERITEYGIGNGTSLIIFVGIMSTAATSFVGAIRLISEDPNPAMKIWFLIGFLLLVIGLFFLIVFIDLSERRIPVVYAKRVVGNKQMGGQNTHIPMKVNASGVMPIIFATSILMFPMMLGSIIPTDAAIWWNKWLGVGTPIYYVLLVPFIIFFSYFYAQIQFNPVDVAKNIQQYGGMITGIRPGKPTGEYLKKINDRLTLFGALFLGFISIIPAVGFELLGKSIGMTNAFSATGLLIIVSVALELNKQLESQIMMKHYKGFLK